MFEVQVPDLRLHRMTTAIFESDDLKEAQTFFHHHRRVYPERDVRLIEVLRRVPGCRSNLA